MFSRDYLIRLIEEMSSVLGKVFGLRQENKLTEAEWEIDDLYQRRFRLSGPLIQKLTPEDLITMFTFNRVLEADRVQGVALLLKEQALIDAARQQADLAAKRRMKALHLLVYADLYGAPVKWVKTREEIAELIAQLHGMPISAALHRLLWTYYENIGNYAKAEDHLFHLRSCEPLIRDEGVAFYERLLQLEDPILLAGGLPREELEQGLAILKEEMKDQMKDC